MSFALNDTAELMGVIRTIKSPMRYWLDLCFPRTVTFETESILFDQLTEEGRRLAPFVAPNVQGKVMREDGFTTKAFKPAYTKPKHVVDPTKVFHRTAGEGIGGMDLSPQQRWDAAVARNLASELKMIDNRCEWMAAQAVLFAQVTVAGENYPTQTVDFGRDASLTPTALSGGAAWDQTTAKPLRNLDTWMALMQSVGRTTPNRVTMGLSAWGAFADRVEAEKILDIRRVNGAPDLNLGVGDGQVVQYKGTLRSGVDIYVYSEVYVDDTGAEIQLMDPRDVVLTSPAIAGVRAFGAIMDARAGLRALQYFPKMWEQEDPSVVYTMTQSAPLMVPTFPNASLRVRVMA
jgi:hypothetical protein